MFISTVPKTLSKIAELTSMMRFGTVSIGQIRLGEIMMNETKNTQHPKVETKNTQHPKVEIAVKNFGPIAEANIDLRPLTVFVGPSNTGKTYFATLVYALHGISGGFTPLPLVSVLHQLRSRYFLSVSADEKKAARELLKATIELFKKLVISRSSFKFSDLPQALRDHLQSSLTDPEIIGRELNRCFDFKSISDLIRFMDSKKYEMQVLLKVRGESQEWWDLNMMATESDITVDGLVNANLVLAPEDEPLWDSIPRDEFTDYAPMIEKGIICRPLEAVSSKVIESWQVR